MAWTIIVGHKAKELKGLASEFGEQPFLNEYNTIILAFCQLDLLPKTIPIETLIFSPLEGPDSGLINLESMG